MCILGCRYVEGGAQKSLCVRLERVCLRGKWACSGPEVLYRIAVGNGRNLPDMVVCSMQLVAYLQVVKASLGSVA